MTKQNIIYRVRSRVQIDSVLGTRLSFVPDLNQCPRHSSGNEKFNISFGFVCLRSHPARLTVYTCPSNMFHRSKRTYNQIDKRILLLFIPT